MRRKFKSGGELSKVGWFLILGDSSCGGIVAVQGADLKENGNEGN